MKSKRKMIIAGFVAMATWVNAAEYYMTPSGAGTQSGADWDNALPKSQMNTTLNTTMLAGDSLFLGSGNYGSTTISLSSSGTEGAWKQVIGVNTGSGVPHFSGNGNWSRSNPDSGQWQIIGVTGSYWIVDNLELSGVRYAVKNSTSSTASHYLFRNLLIHDVRHGVYLSYLDDSRFENVVVTEYSKQGFRLDRGCDNVVFENCVADLSGEDASWWDYSEPFPYGFVTYDKGPHTNISFVNCVAANHRRNNQGDMYWNGDGFLVEDTTTGAILENCLAINNEDGGFDLKVATTLTNCVSVLNYRGFRFWGNSTAENCVAVAPYRRSFGNPTGGYGGAGVWTNNGTSTLSYFTFYADAGTAAHEDGSGSLTLTDSILAFSGTSGNFTSGSITLGAGTVTYRPGSGTDPAFVNASSAWDGTGDDLNSLTYGDTKGYYIGSNGQSVISANITSSSTYKLDAGDIAGAQPVGNWNNIGIDAAGDAILGNTVNLSDAIDNNGNSTGVTLTIGGAPFGYINNTSVTSPDSKMMASERGSSSNGDIRVIQATNVPYASYDVYVYFGGVSSGGSTPYDLGLKLQEPDGFGWWRDMTPASEVLYMRDTNRTWDGSFDESTATTAATADDSQEYVVFRNVTLNSFRVRTDAGVGRRAGLSGFQIVESSAFEPALVFESGNFSDYANQSASGSMNLEDLDTSIHLTGNIWRKYAFDYTVTANTVLEVTLDASNVGELTCIGFDTDNNYLTSTTNIKLGGSQTHASFPPFEYPYTPGSGPVTFLIDIGTLFTGDIDYLTFIGDDDAASAVDVTFSKVRIYEEE